MLDFSTAGTLTRSAQLERGASQMRSKSLKDGIQLSSRSSNHWKWTSLTRVSTSFALQHSAIDRVVCSMCVLHDPVSSTNVMKPFAKLKMILSDREQTLTT